MEDDPEATEEGEDGDDGVGGDAEDGDGNVLFRGGGIFVEAAGREDGEAAMVDGAAVPFAIHLAGRGLAGIHVVYFEGKDGDDETGKREQGNQKSHGPFYGVGGCNGDWAALAREGRTRFFLTEPGPR